MKKRFTTKSNELISDSRRAFSFHLRWIKGLSFDTRFHTPVPRVHPVRWRWMRMRWIKPRFLKLSQCLNIGLQWALEVSPFHDDALYKSTFYLLTVCKKRDSRNLEYIGYSCKPIAMKFKWYPHDLSYLRVHNLPPHLSYVSTLPDIMTLHKKKLIVYVVFRTIVRVALILACKWVWKEPIVRLGGPQKKLNIGAQPQTFLYAMTP